MQRSGGRAGRPFAHVSIGGLESHVRAHSNSHSELLAILAELGRRKTKRSEDLKSLVTRLLADARPRAEQAASPMFE